MTSMTVRTGTLSTRSMVAAVWRASAEQSAYGAYPNHPGSAKCAELVRRRVLAGSDSLAGQAQGNN